MFRIFVTFILIIINFVIQSTIAREFAIGSTMVNYILILIVSFALIRGKLDGALIGFFSGLLYDFFFGDVIGFYALIYMYIGFSCGFLYRTFYKDNVVIPIVIIGIADFAFNIIIYIFTYLFRGRTDISFYIYKIILPEVLLTLVVSIVVYRFYLYVNRIVRAKETREENFDEL